MTAKPTKHAQAAGNARKAKDGQGVILAFQKLQTSSLEGRGENAMRLRGASFDRCVSNSPRVNHRRWSAGAHRSNEDGGVSTLTSLHSFVPSSAVPCAPLLTVQNPPAPSVASGRRPSPVWGARREPSPMCLPIS